MCSLYIAEAITSYINHSTSILGYSICVLVDMLLQFLWDNYLEETCYLEL